MELIADLLKTMASGVSKESDADAQRRELLSVLRSTQLTLNSIPFERTEIHTFIRLRREYDFSVRPLFLKYLYKVEPTFISKTFSKEDQYKIQRGFLPSGWTIHHQRPLSCGGLSIAQEYDKRIRKIRINPADLEAYPEDKRAYYAYARQLYRFLRSAEKKGHLRRTFYKMFQCYMILLPRQVHKNLEDAFLTPQKLALSASNEENPTFYFPCSPLLIYGNTGYKEVKNPKLKKIRYHEDDAMPYVTSKQLQNIKG